MPRQSLGIVSSLSDDDWLKWWGVAPSSWFCAKSP